MALESVYSEVIIRDQNGRNVCDVIDGKQQLKTIYMFTQFGRFDRDRFDLKLDDDSGPGGGASHVEARRYRARVIGYCIDPVSLLQSHTIYATLGKP